MTRDYKRLAMMVVDWKRRNPEKYKAQKMIFVAVRNGTLKRYPCDVCGDQKSEAHHEDYSKPLKVDWYCKKHHGEADKARREREKLSPTLV